MKAATHNQRGLTLIEIVFGMVIFALVMVVAINGLFLVVRGYQNGVATRKTQESARQALEEVVRLTRLANKASTHTCGGFEVLFLEQPGSIAKFYSVASSPSINRLKKIDVPAPTCVASEIAGTDEYLTGDNVSVRQFEPKMISTTSVQVKLTVSTPDSGSEVDLTTNPPSCRPGRGSHFCSVTTVQSSASLRGKE